MKKSLKTEVHKSWTSGTFSYNTEKTKNVIEKFLKSYGIPYEVNELDIDFYPQEANWHTKSEKIFSDRANKLADKIVKVDDFVDKDDVLFLPDGYDFTPEGPTQKKKSTDTMKIFRKDFQAKDIGKIPGTEPFSQNEGMYVGSDGTLRDDEKDNRPVDKSQDIPTGTEIVDVLILGDDDKFAHKTLAWRKLLSPNRGEVAVTKWFDDNDITGEGVVVKVDSSSDEKMLHKKGKLKWDDQDETYVFYPYNMNEAVFGIPTRKDKGFVEYEDLDEFEKLSKVLEKYDIKYTVDSDSYSADTGWRGYLHFVPMKSEKVKADPQAFSNDLKRVILTTGGDYNLPKGFDLPYKPDPKQKSRDTMKTFDKKFSTDHIGVLPGTDPFSKNESVNEGEFYPSTQIGSISHQRDIDKFDKDPFVQKMYKQGRINVEELDTSYKDEWLLSIDKKDKEVVAFLKKNYPQHLQIDSYLAKQLAESVNEAKKNKIIVWTDRRSEKQTIDLDASQLERAVSSGHDNDWNWNIDRIKQHINRGDKEGTTDITRYHGGGSDTVYWELNEDLIKETSWDEIAMKNYGVSYDELNYLEQEWVRDKMDRDRGVMEEVNESKMKRSELKQMIKEAYNNLLKEEDAEQILYHLDLKDIQEKEITDKRAIYTTTSDPEYVKNQLQSSPSKYITGPEWKHYYKSYNVLNAGGGLTQIVFHKFPPGEMSDVDFDREQNVQAQYRDEVNENKTTMKRSELKAFIKEAYLESLREEDDEDIEDVEDDFEAEPAVDRDGESRTQEEAPRKRINFENRELEMLVDVNRNKTKKGIKIQFLSDDELSKEERAKLVSSLQTYLDEGLAKFVKGAKLNVDSDQDVPNKTKTVGFTIKIGDVFGLVSKVFANRGDDEEEAGGEEDFEAETEEFPEEELNENISNVRKYLYDYARELDSEGKLKLAKELTMQAQSLRSMVSGASKEELQELRQHIRSFLKESFRDDITAAKAMIDAGATEEEVIQKYGVEALDAVNFEAEDWGDEMYETSNKLKEDVNQSKLKDIEQLVIRYIDGPQIDGLDDEDNEEILKILNYPSNDYSNEYKVNKIIDFLGDYYSLKGSPEEFKAELLNIIKEETSNKLKEDQFVGKDGEFFEIDPEDLAPALEHALGALDLEELGDIKDKKTLNRLVSMVLKSSYAPERFSSLEINQQLDILQTAEMYI